MKIENLPRALVRVTLESIEIGSGELLAALTVASNPYVLAYIGERRIGRSRVLQLPTEGDWVFRLDEDPSGFEHELRVSSAVPIRVDFFSDHSDQVIASVGGTIDPPWSSGKRVIETGSPEGQVLHLSIQTRHVPEPLRAVAPRVAAGTTSLATLFPLDCSVVKITSIRGLYRPTDSFEVGKPAAVYEEGYKSEDDRGRIYLNRDLDGHWKANYQQIELTAEVVVARGFPVQKAKIRWTIVDVDDPFNDDPGTHPEAGVYADRKDYDPNDGKHLGSRGHDNEGKPDYAAVWQRVNGFGLSIQSVSMATTDVVDGRSSVILHCPNLAGDNFVVRADLVTDTKVEWFPDFTGIMTMWNRFDVEYLRMESASELPFGPAMVGFEPACVQLDVHPARIVPDQAFIYQSMNAFYTYFPFYMRTHLAGPNRGGWLGVLAALEAWPLPEPRPGTVQEIEILGHVNDDGSWTEWVDLPGHQREAFLFTLQWGDDHTSLVEFMSDSRTYLAKENVTRCILKPHQYNCGFTAHDFGPSVYFGARWQTGRFDGRAGYGIPRGPVRATISWEGNRPLRGDTYGIPTRDGNHAAARVCIFTRGVHKALGNVDARAIDAELALSLFHEMTHSLDFPHMCGAYNHRNGRTHSCVMNYQRQWLIEPDRPFAGNLVPDSGETPQMGLCSRHVKEMRRTHMEDNPLLWWK